LSIVFVRFYDPYLKKKKKKGKTKQTKKWRDPKIDCGRLPKSLDQIGKEKIDEACV